MAKYTIYQFVYEDGYIYKHFLTDEEYNKLVHCIRHEVKYIVTELGLISLQHIRSVIPQKELPAEQVYGADPDLNREEREWLRQEREKDLDPETEDDDGEEI